MALALGLSGGLGEGVIHLVLQRLNVLDNSWYQIIWIAATFNALVLGTLALMCALVLSSVASSSPA